MEYTVPEYGCEKGCKHFSGGEVKHHPDCQYCPESMSKQLDEMGVMEQHYKDLWIATTHLIHAIQTNDKKKFNKYLNGVKILVHYPSYD